MSLSWQVPFREDADFPLEITPRFLNWERSFVSGPESPLFRISHWTHPREPGILLSRVAFLPRAEGPPRHVHGGASAGLLDEVMGVLAWHHHHSCVTRDLSLHYARALPLDLDGRILTRIVKTEEASLELHATIFDRKGRPHVLARGMFHILNPEQLARFHPGI